MGLDDVQRAVEILKESSVIVGSPKQFLDVGYLTKVTDSEGLTLELLQNTMEKNFKGLPVY